MKFVPFIFILHFHCVADLLLLFIHTPLVLSFMDFYAFDFQAEEAELLGEKKWSEVNDINVQVR